MKIILGHDKKTPADKIRFPSGKQTLENNDNVDNLSDVQIPGDCNKLNDNTEDPDLVFKPRKSIGRSPTKDKPKNVEREILDGPAVDNSGKRHRSVMSPGEENCHKKPCDGIKTVAMEKEAPVPPENHASISRSYEEPEKMQMGNILNDMFEALAKIKLHTNEEVNGNPVISKYSQEMVRNSTIDIHKNLALITLKLGQLEQEKMLLAHKLQLKEMEMTNALNTHSGQAGHLKSVLTKEKTYAAVTQREESPKTNNEQEKQIWTTPKISKKLETLVKIDNISDPKETMRQLKKEIEGAGIERGFKNIRHLKSGAIVVESCNEMQQKKLKNTLENKNNIKVKENEVMNPMFMVTGILKGYSDTEFVEELVRMNDEIENEVNIPKIQDKIKVIAKKPCRNPAKENWILQAQPAIAKWFLKRETVNFDLMRVYVQEHFNLAICFRCCGFGHVAKFCNESILCCHKCGAGDHPGSECQSTQLKCVNCIKMKYKPEESRHSARDINCPVYQRKLKSYKSQINYSEQFL